MFKIRHNINLFILILSLIGLSSGYIYYQIQDQQTKDELINAIDIKDELNSGINNIPKRIKIVTKIFFYGLTLIPQIINVFNIFYMPFEIGFILNLLESFSLKFSVIYITIYHIIPLIFTLLLIRISLKLSKFILELLVFKDKISIKNLRCSLKKYIFVSLLLFFYEFLLLIFSKNINTYLVVFFNK